jgi:hypothetical protein
VRSSGRLTLTGERSTCTRAQPPTLRARGDSDVVAARRHFAKVINQRLVSGPSRCEQHLAVELGG